MIKKPTYEELEQRVKELEKEAVEHKRVEEALQESEKKFSKLFQTSPVHTSVTGLEDGRFLEVNDVFTKVTGYEREEVIGRTTTEIGLWANPKERVKFVELAKEKGRFRDQRVEFLKKNGKPLIMLWSAEKIEIGGKECFISALADITEVEKAEKRLKESEELYRSVVEQASEGIFLYDYNTNEIVDTNKAFRKMLGYTKKEMSKLTVYDFIAHEKEEIDSNIDRIVKEKYYFLGERKYRSKVGALLDVEASSSLISFGGKEVLCVVIRDITERKQTQEALRESEELYSNIFESVSDGILSMDSNFCYTHWNRAMEEISKTPRDQMLGDQRLPWEIFPHLVDQGVDEMMRDAMAGKIVHREDIPYHLEDGTLGFTSETFLPLRRADGEIRGIVGVVREVSERKEAEKALRESEERFVLFMDHFPDVVFMKDLKGRLVYANKTYQRRGGHKKKEDWYGKTNDQLWPPETAASFNKGDQEVLSKGRSMEFIESLPHPDGHIRTQMTTKFPVLKDRESVYLGGIGLDITDLKQTEEALRESEQRFRHAFENANTGVCLVSTDGHFIKVNDRLCEIFGYSKEKLEGMPVNDITHPEDLELSPEFFKRSISGEMENIVYEKRYIHSKGHLVWGQISSSIVRGPEGEPLYFISHVQDITQHKLAEEALKKSEEKFSKLFQASPTYISLATLEEGRFVAVNDAFTRITGYQPNEVIGRTFREIGLWPDPDDRDDFIGQIEKDGRQYLQEVTLTRKDGGLIEGLWSVEKIELGGKDHLISMLIDITERKQIQEDLRESEQRFREMADLLPTIVCEIDMDLRVTYANSLAFETTGFTQEDFEAGINAMDLLHPGDREKAAKRIEQTVKGVKLNPAEYRLLRKDGSEIPVLLNSAPIYKDGEMVGIRACLVDIGEQNELQSRLQKAQRMEALGLMAGGVAHDLNNILSGIVTYPELILMGLPEDSPLRKPLKTMQESGMKAADVVSDMLTIARGATISKEVSNLNTIVKGYLASVEHQKLGKAFLSLTFKTDLDPGLLNVSCSKIHIEKALMNLVTNASEAIERRGTVSISTMNRYLDEPLKGYDDVTIGEYALLRVSDDGSGILPDDLDRVFEPFYTKKEMGRSGTGLGLAVVWNTIQDHDGYVEVKSSEKGTIFELYFPVTRERMAKKEEEVPLEDYLGNGEKILVVDDDERQREIASGLLTQLNYNAEAVSSGEEAIEYVKEHPVDLIVLDMVMPRGINGRKTYEEIIKIRPKQKAIIASGYAKTREVDIAQRLGAGKYIKKPYILEKIGVAVKEELEK